MRRPQSLATHLTVFQIVDPMFGSMVTMTTNLPGFGARHPDLTALGAGREPAATGEV